MRFRRCPHRSAEWKALRKQGYQTIAVNTAGIALLVRLEAR